MAVAALPASMEVALLTVGDELLAGDTENTNAAWLARRLTDRGADVRRILTVPDDRDLVARWVREFADAFDAVVVTGGLGGTHDDVTMAAVADAFDRALAAPEEVVDALHAKARRFREENPDLAEEYDMDLDLESEAAVPEGAESLVTEASFNPGCVVENVYVLPGFPEEMKVMFEAVADDFGGETVAESFRTPAPEGSLTGTLAAARERFDVAVGSYPAKGGTLGRVKVTGTDPEEVAAAVAWLTERVETAGESGQ